MPATARKEQRIQLRASKHEVKTIARAAATAGVSVSAFILDSASERAQHTLADQRHFELNARQWQTFTEALDRPPRRLPHLERLLRETSILER
ncbi:MAG: DUF1778 domain-containing protein [Acidobacteriaceae bacterium]|jgi:uncharacterized protein (DUF1778 family)